MFTLGGYYSSVDPGGAFVNLAAIPDPHLAVTGNYITVPKLSQLMACAALVNQTAAAQARYRSPSLIKRGYEYYLGRLASGLLFGSPPEVADLSDSPLPLEATEYLEVQVLSDPVGAVGHYGLVWFCDGPVAPVKGEIMTVRVTSAIALAAGAWVNGALTFPASLPAGRYQLVGCRAQGPNLVAVRFVIPGTWWRPGVPAVRDEPYQDYPLFRFGKAGVFGEFDNTQPPTLDALGVTDTSQELFLDLIKVG